MHILNIIGIFILILGKDTKRGSMKNPRLPGQDVLMFVSNVRSVQFAIYLFIQSNDFFFSIEVWDMKTKTTRLTYRFQYSKKNTSMNPRKKRKLTRTKRYISMKCLRFDSPARLAPSAIVVFVKYDVLKANGSDHCVLPMKRVIHAYAQP